MKKKKNVYNNLWCTRSSASLIFPTEMRYWVIKRNKYLLLILSFFSSRGFIYTDIDRWVWDFLTWGPVSCDGCWHFYSISWPQTLSQPIRFVCSWLRSTWSISNFIITSGKHAAEKIQQPSKLYLKELWLKIMQSNTIWLSTLTTKNFYLLLLSFAIRISQNPKFLNRVFELF